MILNRLEKMKEYWTSEKVLEFFNYDGDTGVGMMYFDSTPYLVKNLLANAEELLVVCMVVTLFDKVGVKISMLMGYIIWAYYVSEAYAAQWLGCCNMYDCWKDVVVHFLFGNWEEY